MTAEEFNDILDLKATQYLVPLGFKKKGTSYYLCEGENIFSLKKGSFRGTFIGFLFCYGHTFLTDFIDNKGKLKIPGYPENFPLTIDSMDIDGLSKKHESIADFKYEFSFIKRPIKFLYLSKEDEIFHLEEMEHGDNPELLTKTIDEKFIEDTLLQAKTLGLKYMRQLTPQITLKLLSKSDSWSDKNMIQQIRKHQQTSR